MLFLMRANNCPLYGSISIYACQPVLTISISCMKEQIPRGIWGNVSSGVLLSHTDLSVLQTYKALAGTAWDETCEFRRWSSAIFSAKGVPHFLYDNSKKELQLKMWHYLATWRLFLCKHDFTLSLICYTVIL